MNLLPKDKLDALEKCFAENRGIRETERLTGVHRDTVSRYFRLMADPNPNAEPDLGGTANFEVVEHDNEWHVFCWHDDTPDWWRHIAIFHSERRARDYASDATWTYFTESDHKEAKEAGHPLPDEGAAPDTLPAPPTVVEAYRPLTREQRQAEREQWWDEGVAALPPRYCEICMEMLTRRAGETPQAFGKRLTCSPEHAQALRDRRREERAATSRVIEPAPANGPANPGDDSEPKPNAITPPGYKDCPDCVWSGPLVDYRDHRRTDHGAAP